MSPEQWREFLDSLDGEKGLPDEMHGIPFSAQFHLTDLVVFDERQSGRLTETQCANYWKERCRRAESRQIPDLKERVKELMRDAMDAQAQHQSGMGWTDANKLISEFRALCAPEVKP